MLHQNEIDEPNIYGQKNAIVAIPPKNLQGLNQMKKSVVGQYKKNWNSFNEIQVIGTAKNNAQTKSNFYKINS